MPLEFSRRQLLGRILATSASLAVFDCVTGRSQAADLAPLDGKDSAASALGFVIDASTAGSNPVYRKGQHCASCMHYLGTPSDLTSGCNIYPGRSVPANGWCSVWVARPG